MNCLLNKFSLIKNKLKKFNKKTGNVFTGFNDF